jgi:uncharacterized membrane protein YbhN (UPF0104 family)
MPWIFAGVSLSYALAGMSDQIDVGLGDAIVISTAATLVALLNLVLPGGLALKEVTMIALLLPWMPASAALVVSFAYRLLHTANEMLWALAVTALPSRPAPDASEPSPARQTAP